ncbi:uncharacterized protein LOC121865185 [Homarus americanus]|nr:uncharacterized protein LOC121865185 [Homarus americanus]
MSMWMGSQAGGWPGSTRMNYHSKVPIVPQVKLQLDVHPPVLDTGQKQMPTKTFGGGIGKQIQGGSGGQFWKSFRTMYESLCSGTPLTWVNPDAVGQQHPPYQLYPQVQYQCNVQPDIMYEDSSGLWYPAPPAGSRIDYMDPLIIWQESPCPLFNFLPEFNGTQLPQKVEDKKVCRPLNPEAKEWIPKEYIKDCEASTSSPRKETSDADCFETKLPYIPNGLQYPANEDGLSDFCEITDTEVYAVRIGESDSFNSVPKGRVPQVTKKKLGAEKEGFKEKTVAIPVPSVIKDVPPAEDPSSYGCRDVEIHVCDNLVKDNRPSSYASIVGGTAASPTPQTHVCGHSFEKNSASRISRAAYT